MSVSQLRSFFTAYISLAFILSLAASASAQQSSVVANSAAQSAPQAGTTPETKFEVADVARRAILFTKYALDVRLETRDATMHVRAIVTVKNDSAVALDAIPLQISSSLQWEAINSGGKPLHFARHTVATDARHPGAMNEALVTLAAPLAPGGEQTLTVFYSGSAAPTAKRLETIGTPPDVAIHADWDGVRDDFTGLRGFGNVLWYPVCNVPVVLGDSDRFFSEIGMTKLRESSAMVSMTVKKKFTGAAPTVAFLDGVPVAVEERPLLPAATCRASPRQNCR